MIPEIFRIGPFPINSFGLLMVAAFLCAWRILAINIKRAGDDSGLAENLVFWAALGGVVGARILYLLTYAEGFWDNPLENSVSGAGFVFYGGLLGGLLAAVVLLHRSGKPIGRYADLIAPSLALGYAVGRIGCQLSGDGDYGIASSLPWAMSYELGVVATAVGERVHPAPVYETFAALAITFICQWALWKPAFQRVGGVFGLCLLLMGVERFLVEIIRIEPTLASGFTQAQLVSVGLVCFGAVLVLRAGFHSSTQTPT